MNWQIVIVAILSVGLVLLLFWQFDRRRAPAEKAPETPNIAVVLDHRNIRTTVDQYGGKHDSYWWTVIRQDTSEEQTLQVTKGEYHLHAEGETFKLQ
jgi:hypothetical protein